MRAVDEWIGKTPDSQVPPRVRVRIFEREKGICHISGRKIMPGDRWDLDHIVALCNGGLNIESNLAPALRDRHRGKTAIDVKLKAKVARIRKRHLGLKKPSRFFGSRDSGWKKKIDGTVVRR